MWTIVTTILLPLLKWLFEKQAGKKLSDKEFVKMVVEHRMQREGAGQTVLDWKASVAKLKGSMAKKKTDDTKE